MLNLTKAEIKEKTALVLTKRGVPNPPKSAVLSFFDTSGSFKDEWEDGIVSMLAERVLAVASRFDSDGKLAMYHFNNSVYDVGEFDFEKDDVKAYLKSNLLNKRGELWGGTEYADILQKVAEKVSVKKQGGVFGGLFGSKKTTKTLENAPEPTLVYIITDGDNSDYDLADDYFKKAENLNYYFMFINAETMSKRAKSYADNYNNVGYAFFPKLRTMSDEQILESLVTEEFLTWRKKYP